MSQHTLTLLRFTYKKLKEKLTVSDSKKLFHEKFPYVIPGLYKRIVDEMLVELNLLNHQNEFTQDNLFCVGLTETFTSALKEPSCIFPSQVPKYLIIDRNFLI